MKHAVTFSLMLGALLTCTSLRADYSELRQLPGSPGQQYQFNAGKISGTFNFQTSNPFGTGDDGGIVIAANGGGYWVRDFSCTSGSCTISDPVQMDWFEVVNDQDITALWKQIRNNYGEFYVQLPSTPMNLRWTDTSHYNWTGDFVLLESDAQVTLSTPTDAGALSSFENPYWKFTNFDLLVMGTDTPKTSRDDYNFTFLGPWTNTNRGSTDTDGVNVYLGAMMDFYGNNNSTIHLRLNSRYPHDSMFRLRGNNISRTFYMSGVHRYGGSLSVIDQYSGTYHFEDALFADELDSGGGWTGTSAGNLDKDLGLIRRNPVKFAPSGRDCGRINTITGRVERSYGRSELSFWDIDAMGTSISDPFKLVVTDYGYTGDATLAFQENRIPAVWPSGTALSDTRPGSLFNNHPIKNDNGNGCHDGNYENTRFWEYETVRNFGRERGPKRLFFVENRQADSGGGESGFQNQLFTWVNADGEYYYENGTQDGDIIRGIIHQGNGVDVAFLDYNIDLTYEDVVRYGQFHDITMETGIAQGGSEKHFGDDNKLIDVTMTGELNVKSGGTGNVATNLTFIGSARQVATVNGEISISNLCAPAGSTINGSGSLTVNGTTVSLPYSIRQSDCLTPLVNIPPNPLYSPSTESSLNEGAPRPPTLIVLN